MRLLRMVITGLLAICCMALVLTSAGCSDNESAIHLEFSDPVYNIANYKQHQSYAQLNMINNKLYLFSESELYVYDNGRFQRILEAKGEGIAYAGDKYIYQDTFGADAGIYSFDLETRESTRIADDMTLIFRHNYTTEDGVLYMCKWASDFDYYAYDGLSLTYEPARFESFNICGNTYTREVVEDRLKLKVVRYDTYGQRTVYELPDGILAMFPYEEALIINLGLYGEMLYMIDGETGELTQLFSAGDYEANSAVNVYNGYLYLSFVRFTEEGFKLTVMDENDTLNGTYRINLSNFSVEKISDDIYVGLFIFDDTGIYGCRRDGIVCKLDFDGNIICELPGFEGHSAHTPNLDFY